MKSTFLTGGLNGDFTHAFSWTLVHSLWQGALCALLAALVITLTRRSTASLRYNLLSAIFILFIAAASFTFLYKYSSHHTSEHPQQSAQTIQATTSNLDLPSEEGEGSSQRFVDLVGSFCEQNSSLIVMLWFMVFLVQCFRLFTGFFYVQALRRRRVSAVPGEWRDRLNVLCQRMNIPGAIGFMQSELVKVPLMMGHLKPVILVPVGMFTQLTAEQVETILLHELAHVRRKDYLVNLLQSFAETIFFFNPALLWISGMIREEREACCDDFVLGNTSDPAPYLQALVNFNEHRFQKAYAMGLGTTKTSLLNRVRRMITYENKKLNVMEKLFLVSGVVLFTAFSLVNHRTDAPALINPTNNGSIQPASLVSPLITKNKVETIVTPNVASQVAYAREVDTVPQKSGYSHLSTYTSDEGPKTSVIQIQSDKNGKKYKVKKVDGKVVDIYVDNERVEDADMGKYKEQIEEADRWLALQEKFEKEREAENKIRIEEARQRVIEDKERAKEAEVRARESQERNREAEERRIMSQKLSEDAKVRAEEAKQRTEEAKQRAEESRQRSEEAKQRSIEAKKRNEEAKKTLTGIVDDLKKENLIKDSENFSFVLDYKSLTVDGVRQSDELQGRFRDKYKLKKGDIIDYSRSGDRVNIKQGSID